MMTPQQVATAKRIGPGLVLWLAVEAVCLWRGWVHLGADALFLFGVYALVVELLAVKQGGYSTESELAWWLWAYQPWVPALVSVLAAAVLGYVAAARGYTKVDFLVLLVVYLVGCLWGHLFMQSSDKVERIRKGDPA